MAVSVLRFDKETEGKLRWSCLVAGTPFRLYVPRWRVPRPVPKRIQVGVEPIAEGEADPERLTRAQADDGPWSLLRPIRAVVQHVEEHTKTNHYAPVGDEGAAEMGQPYVPRSLCRGAGFLVVTVEWDANSMGETRAR